MTVSRPTRAAPSRRRARAVASGLTVAAGLVTAAIPLLAGDAPARPQVLLAIVAVVALGAGLVGWSPALTVGGLAFATEYALRLQHHHGLDGIAIAEAVAIFATIELGLRALDARSIARPGPAVRVRSRWTFAASVVGAAACAFVVLALGSRQLPAPTAGLALGLAAAAALLGAAELLRRRATTTG